MSDNHTVPAAVCEEEVVTSVPSQVELKTATKFSRSEFYNGAKFENYCWSQTDSEIEITILLPEYVKKSNDLSVVIKSNTVDVRCKSRNIVLFEGELSSKVKHTEAIWNISKNKLQISLDKSTDKMWTKLLTTETDIKGNDVDCTMPFSNLPDDLRMEVERLDKQRNEEKIQELSEMDTSREALLRKAWDAEGSPFKGIPFDPSKVNFD